ncbi:MAG: cysteine hydrolase family protein [Bacillota bacterium]|nr:cysteine hydrolase family protein [Bacillota bacterium]
MKSQEKMNCKEKEALLIIDVQNDYFPGGACELKNAYEAEERIISLISKSRAMGRPIIYIQHKNPPDVNFLVEGTLGCEISERIKPDSEDKVIVKYFPNSFLETELDDYLKKNNITKLIVCGMMTHMCVDTTVRAAMDYGYEVDLVADACATKDLEIQGESIPAQIVQRAFIASLEGVFANIV